MNLFETAKRLSTLPAVSGREHSAHQELKEICGNLFDEYYSTPTGSLIAIKRCEKANAKRLLLDAHLDEIGFLIKDIHENGFISVVNVGGIDTGILSAAEVNIYGTKVIKGIFTSKPPHLQDKDESEKKPKLSELYIDTGLASDKLKEIAPIGTPVAFSSSVERLIGDRICGKTFDDRICILSILRAVSLIDAKDLNYDIYAMFSGGEEIGYIGATTGAFEIQPDIAIVLDVCNAYVDGADEFFKLRKLGDGSVISYSSTTCRKTTEKLISIANEDKLPIQIIAEPSRTGTNAHVFQLIREGIPCALISIPLLNMHTYNEIIDLKDVESTAKLLAGFMKRPYDMHETGVKAND